jgi:hypothetical protein
MDGKDVENKPPRRRKLETEVVEDGENDLRELKVKR